VSDAFLRELRPVSGRRHRVSLDAVIGREGCEIEISDPQVSRRHAALRGVEGGIGIEDLGSRNGTLVNGERVDGVRALREGDEVHVGETVLLFELAAGVAAAAPADGAARGDVPAPDPVPSVVRRAAPLEAAGPPAFAPVTRRKIRGSAARRVEATVISYGVVVATAIALIVYFATR
jgi:pSer/pThr/pTyr-binding forkhead associated (FHA) protein